MKRTTFCLIVICGLLNGCKKNTTSTFRPAHAPTEADFASSSYSPVPTNSSAAFLIEQKDLNHNGTGEQGVLLETLNTSTLDTDPLNASPTGYHYFLYNPRIHQAKEGSLQCDLKALTDDYKVLMTDLNGEGFITAQRIALEGERFTGYSAGGACDFIITAVHSDRAIPDDVWTRADAMWKQKKQKTAAIEAPALKEGERILQSSDATTSNASESSRGEVTTKQVEVVGQIFDVQTADGRPCIKNQVCWWDVVVEEGGNQEWSLSTTKKPPLEKGQYIRAVAKVTSRTDKFMTKAEIEAHLPGLISYRVVSPETDTDAAAAAKHIKEDDDAFAGMKSN